MSTRPQFSPYVVIPNAQASPANSGSMAANITSAPTVVQKLSMVSYSVSWSGTSPVGALSVEVSNDFSLNADGTVKNAGTWSTLTLEYAGSLVTSVPVTGNTGNGFIDVRATASYATRLVYTATSGTGTLTATINAKVT